MPNYLLKKRFNPYGFLVEMGSSKIGAHLWVDIRIYGIGRKRCTRVEGCASAAEGPDTAYMDSNAHGSIAYIVPHIYDMGTARSLHTKGIRISLLHIP